MASRLDLVRYSIKGLKYRALRSWLTILGVVIGISVIVVLVSLGQGITGFVNKEMEGFGPNNIMVMPGSSMPSSGPGPGQAATKGKLYKNDMDRLSRLEGIELMTPFLYGVFSVSYKEEFGTFTISGVEPENYAEAFPSMKIAQGRMLKSGDRRVIVIGDKIAKGLFNEDLQVGSLVKIRDRKFKVIGVMERTGGTFDDTDTSVIAPFEDIEELMSASISKGEIAGILLVMKKGTDISGAEEDSKEILRNAHKVREGEEDFMVISAESISGQIGAITGMLTAFLGAIAGISLFVGGITVANTMFMSVLERVKEIGTLKSIGATSGDLLFIFLFESASIGLLGGVIGIAAGLVLVFLLSLVGVPVAPSIELVGFCLAFSVALGAVSGFLPARQAAKMNAVDALRYE